MSAYGVGINDKGQYLRVINKKATLEGSYWADMLKRCYDKGSLRKYPTYADCTVDHRFHRFQHFAAWANDQAGWGREKYCLDKDILVRGNKIYSPETCVFVPREINLLLVLQKSARGKYPLGVHFSKRGKFAAQCCINGKQTPLGFYDTPEDAFAIYKRTKESLIKEAAEKHKGAIDPRAYTALHGFQILITD